MFFIIIDITGASCWYKNEDNTFLSFENVRTFVVKYSSFMHSFCIIFSQFHVLVITVNIFPNIIEIYPQLYSNSRNVQQATLQLVVQKAILPQSWEHRFYGIWISLFSLCRWGKRMKIWVEEMYMRQAWKVHPSLGHMSYWPEFREVPMVHREGGPATS